MRIGVLSCPFAQHPLVRRAAWQRRAVQAARRAHRPQRLLPMCARHAHRLDCSPPACVLSCGGACALSCGGACALSCGGACMLSCGGACALRLRRPRHMRIRGCPGPQASWRSRPAQAASLCSSPGGRPAPSSNRRGAVGSDGMPSSSPMVPACRSVRWTSTRKIRSPIGRGPSPNSSRTARRTRQRWWRRSIAALSADSPDRTRPRSGGSASLAALLTLPSRCPWRFSSRLPTHVRQQQSVTVRTT